MRDFFLHVAAMMVGSTSAQTICSNALNSGVFYSTGAPLPCSYFQTYPNTCMLPASAPTKTCETRRRAQQRKRIVLFPFLSTDNGGRSGIWSHTS